MGTPPALLMSESCAFNYLINNMKMNSSSHKDQTCQALTISS